MAMEQERAMRRRYRADQATIVVFLVFAWVLLALVLRETWGLSPGKGTDPRVVRGVLVGSALLAGAFATAALMAVWRHLGRNREALYREDIEAGDK